MATILFQAAGAALGGVFGPFGAILGRAAGAVAGSMVDRALIGGGSTISGARLATARIPGADDGTAINRLYGTARIGGTLIWATRFEEEVSRERAGAKATGPRVETFRYFANLAVGLCEGEIASVRRVWADGREIDLTSIEMRVYRGDEAQLPDPLIEAKQGAGKAPAYRGLAYVVFERLPLDTFGNRIPLLQFEVLRPVGTLERQIRAVTIIPGATEHGYATTQVTEKTGEGSARILNRHTLVAATDWQASLDELQAVCPNLERVALVVSWFGMDLRAGHCRIVPGVEVSARQEESLEWSVAGIARVDAHVVSQIDGPVYGGTPSDESVRQAIADLKARGLKVYLYPFLMMDIAPGNGLPDPYGAAEQAAFPWRGRITCFPAPGRPGTADRTAAARDEIEVFSNGPEGYRRMVLHYADLAQAAGGIDGFIVGSELRGLTQLRDDANGFPFVNRLVELAGEIRALVGGETKLTYAADWSEYFGYHPQDGSGDIFFHLDPLWTSPHIDAVGIDNYMPLADWRDDDLSGLNPDGFRLADDIEAMQRQTTAGEGFDWFYASEADRAGRLRTPIGDELSGKPWVFRYKDIGGWWLNRHFERIGGVEKTVPTEWAPGMKPIWFTELGCPAVDKGANQPNVFVDPKSAESALPYFSAGGRSDSMQRRFLEAHYRRWQAGMVDSTPAGMVDPEPAGMVDPVPVDMVDPDHIFIWAWDSRSYPAFPDDLSVWRDGDNWRTGHWLNGRLGGATLADTIASILTEHGFTDFDVSQVSGDLTGYVQGEVGPARGLIEPLVDIFQIDVAEDAGRLRFRSRLKASLPPREISVVADISEDPLWSESRGHDSDFPAEVVLTSYNPRLDYEQAGTRSRRVRTENRRTLSYDLPAALPQEAALDAVENLLRSQRIARRTLSFALSPAEIAVEPGDPLRLTLPDAENPAGTFIVERIEQGMERRIEARLHAPLGPANRQIAEDHRDGGGKVSDAFAPLLHFLDLPRFAAGEATGFARVAGFCRPWRRMQVSSSATVEGYRMRTALDRPARMGVLTASLVPGVGGRFDRGAAMELDLFFGGLASADERTVLNGENRLAVQSANGVWEVIGFAAAEEIAPGRWRLTKLLRGLAGTEDAMAAGAAPGASVVVLDEAVASLGLSAEERGLGLNWLVESLGQGGGRTGPHVFAGGTRAETPLSPVHVRGERLASGDIRLTWIRRSRIEADSWNAADIPLDEPEERYRAEIVEGEAVRRTAEITAPALIYPAADEIADFGAPQSSLSIRIRQMGRAVPFGIAAVRTIVL